MKQSILLLLAVLLFAACVYFFLQCADHLSGGQYLAGVLHMFVGFGLARTGTELARLAVITRPNVQ